jgi:LacI family transcriptional regulator
LTLRRPRLANIASAAGVSVATVSKVLDGREDVAPTTRALVEDLLQQHYYIGRSANRHPTVELLFHGPLTSYCMEVLEGMFPAAAEAGVAVVVGKGAPGAVLPQGRSAPPPGRWSSPPRAVRP